MLCWTPGSQIRQEEMWHDGYFNELKIGKEVMRMDETNVATTESEVALKRPEGPGADELLFALAAVAPLVRAADGRLHARVPVNDRLSRTRGNSVAPA